MTREFKGLNHRWITIPVALLLAAIVAAALPASGNASPAPQPAQSMPAAPPEPTPGPNGGMGMMSPHERLARPPMSDPPTQLELGHAEYWMSCMVCHGDRGQGLTEEWRSVLDPADQNCWQSRCHAANHPPEGFEIPREAPLVMGTGALSGYRTATDLFQYMRVEMPWSFPGLFDDQTYWALTAYLAEANGVDLPPEPLGPENGNGVLLISGLVQSYDESVSGERLAAGAVVVLLLGGLTLRTWTGRIEIRRRNGDGNDSDA